MKVRIGLILVMGLWGFAVGCGGGTTIEPDAPPPTAAEIEENEGVGAVPSE